MDAKRRKQCRLRVSPSGAVGSPLSRKDSQVDDCLHNENFPQSMDTQLAPGHVSYSRSSIDDSNQCHIWRRPIAQYSCSQLDYSVSQQLRRLCLLDFCSLTNSKCVQACPPRRPISNTSICNNDQHDLLQIWRTALKSGCNRRLLCSPIRSC